MDQRLSEILRDYDMDPSSIKACVEAFMHLSRAVPDRTKWPQEILYCGTDYMLRTQPHIDFRDVMVRRQDGVIVFQDGEETNFLHEIPWHPKNDPIRFGSRVELEIQAGRMYFSSPKSDSFDLYGYRDMQFKVKMAGDEIYLADSSDVESSFAGIPLRDRDSSRGRLASRAWQPWIGAIGNATIEEIQEIFDFLRARFGLIE